jgi:hypothetical protein
MNIGMTKTKVEIAKLGPNTYKNRCAELASNISQNNLLQTIPKKGFLAASERRNLLSEMRMLEGSIRENENRLAMAKH